MGFLGSVFGGGKVEVEGSIAVQNRPTETFFVLTVHFFPCAVKAAPLSVGMPDEVLLAKAISLEPAPHAGGRLSDVGERFATRLSPGHYQVCVFALPMVLEPATDSGRPRVVADPNNRFVFWPLATAVEVRDQKRVLSLKLPFPAGLGRFGERTSSLPFLERIGPACRAAYTRAAELAGRGDLQGSFRAYGEALASPELDRLVPADANELRLVLTLGQFKCLAEAGKVQEAEACRQHLFGTLLPRVRLSEADPATAWDVMSTIAIAGAREGRADLVVESLPAAISVLKPRLAARHEGVERLVHDAIAVCLRCFVAAQNWAGADEVATAVLKVFEPRELLTALPRAYQLEGYLASGGDQRVVGTIAPEGRAVLLRVAQAERLTRLSQALAPVSPRGQA